METFRGRTAVITGAASGLGRAIAEHAATLEMNLVLADIDGSELAKTSTLLRERGCDVLSVQLNVADGAEVEALADTTCQRFGVPNLVFNNAGVAFGGLLWEHSVRDWEWVLGVNLFGVVHGVRAFTPRMLAAEQRDPHYQGHIVNTASMAGLVNAPNLGIYSVSKHAVVSLTETLYHDLSLVSERVRASVLCPYFVPTAVYDSARHRPGEAHELAFTQSQRVAQAMSERAVKGGKVSAAQLANMVFAALHEERFYIFSHPHALGGVKARLEDLLAARNPSDPLCERPELSKQLRAALKHT